MSQKLKQPLSVDAILTPGQIAKFCQVDPRTVTRWIEQNLLVSHALPITKFHRIKVADFLRFLKDQRMPIPKELRHFFKTRILIVDDDPAMRHAIQRMLFEFKKKDYEFETAGDGFAAGLAVQRFRPDLVILDLKMPGMDGFAVCKQIKTNPETRHIRILAVSGTVSDKDRCRVLELGADDYLEKPFPENLLKDRVLKLFSRGQSHE